MAVEASHLDDFLKRYLPEISAEDREVTVGRLMELLAQHGSNPPVYEVVRIDQSEGDQYHPPQYSYCIFWRDHMDVTKGDHEVLAFWADFGIDANKAKHTADILNGRFPAI